MLYFFGKGRLGDDVVEKVNTKSGKLYRVSIAFNRMNKDKEVETLWGSGLINESKVNYQLHLLKKGCPVTFTAQGWVKTFGRKDGTQSTELDLGFIQSLEGGVKLPSREGSESGQQQPQHQQPRQQFQSSPVQQGIPQQQQQFQATHVQQSTPGQQQYGGQQFGGQPQQFAPPQGYQQVQQTQVTQSDTSQQ